MVCQLACQVLGTHQVQHLRRTQRGSQLLRVWGLQGKNTQTQGVPGTKSLPVVRGAVGRQGTWKWRGFRKTGSPEGVTVLTAPSCWDSGWSLSGSAVSPSSPWQIQVLRPSLPFPCDNSVATSARYLSLFFVALPQNPACLPTPFPLLRRWQPARPYQLMHFLWVHNKEPLVEAQGCGHTAGIWLQASDICGDSRGCAEGRCLGGRPGTSWRPCYLTVFFFRQ